MEGNEIMDLRWILFEIGINVYQIGIFLFLMRRLFAEKRKAQHANAAFLICWLLGSAALSAYHFFDISFPPDATVLLVTLIVYTIFFREGHILMKLIWCFVAWGTLGAISITSIALFTTLLRVDIASIFTSTASRVVVVLWGNVLIVPFLFVLPRFQKEHRELPMNDTRTFLILVSIPFVLTAYLTLLLYYFSFLPSELGDSVWLAVSAIGALIMSIAILWLFDHLSKQTRVLVQLEADARETDLQNRHLREIQGLYDRMRMWRHDHRNHVIVMQSLLERKQYDEIFNYIQEFDAKFSSFEYFINTGNISVDALLSTKGAFAQSKGIHFEISMNLPPQLAVTSFDLCNLLGNLVDNAIEACERTQPGTECKIDLSTTLMSHNLQITISNSTDGLYRRSGDSLLSRKPDRANHGFGLRSIDRTVQHYSGFVQREQTDSTFITRILIPCAEILASSETIHAHSA